MLREACNIRLENPSKHYKIIGKIASGSYGTVVHKVQKIEDGSICALKITNPDSATEREDMMNECSLISFLNSEQIIKCQDVFDF